MRCGTPNCAPVTCTTLTPTLRQDRVFACPHSAWSLIPYLPCSRSAILLYSTVLLYSAVLLYSTALLHSMQVPSPQSALTAERNGFVISPPSTFTSMSAPFTHGQQHVAPVLYLYPLNDPFVPKHIALLPQQRLKIGHQTNTKTVPAERNGYFDSKVLSRQHAEVWEQDGKVSSNFPLPWAHEGIPLSRITSRTSEVPTVHLSTMRGRAVKVWNPSLSN